MASAFRHRALFACFGRRWPCDRSRRRCTRRARPGSWDAGPRALPGIIALLMSDLIVIGYDGSPASDHAIRSSHALLSPRPLLVVVVWEPGHGLRAAGYSRRLRPCAVERGQRGGDGPGVVRGGAAIGVEGSSGGPRGRLGRGRRHGRGRGHRGGHARQRGPGARGGGDRGRGARARKAGRAGAREHLTGGRFAAPTARSWSCAGRTPTSRARPAARAGRARGRAGGKTRRRSRQARPRRRSHRPGGPRPARARAWRAGSAAGRTR